jgi:hypothetical protein
VIIVPDTQPRLQFLVFSIVLAALFAAAFVVRFELGFDKESIGAALYFALIGVLALASAYRLPKGGFGNISFVPFLSAVAIAPGLAVVIAVVLAVTLSEMMQRRPMLKATFNVAQFGLGTSAAVLVFHAVGGEPFGPTTAPSILPLAFASVVFFATNKLSFSAVVSVSSGRPFWSLAAPALQGALIYDLFAIPVVYGFAWVYAHFGAGYSLIVTVPIIGLRQLTRPIGNWSRSTKSCSS